LGRSVPIGETANYVFGYCLLNDWSARDIQAWESQPLGPFLGKNFATTISPWVVTAEALAPFRTAAFARSEGDPAPLPHLDDPQDRAEGGLDITLEAYLATEAMRRDGIPARAIDPQGAIYLSAQFDLIGHAGITTNEEIRKLLLERAGFAVVAFQAFGLKQETGWFRLSAGAVSPDDIRNGLARVRKALETL